MAAADRGTYWIVSVPNWWAVGTVMKNQPLSAQAEEEQKKLTRRALLMKTERLCDQYELKIPKLKVGTLDSLMSLSDELGKIDTAAEALVRKIKRTYTELKGKDVQELMVDGSESCLRVLSVRLVIHACVLKLTSMSFPAFRNSLRVRRGVGMERSKVSSVGNLARSDIQDSSGATARRAIWVPSLVCWLFLLGLMPAWGRRRCCQTTRT